MSIDLRKTAREQFERERRRLRRLIVAASAVLIAVLVSVGFFYVRNSQPVAGDAGGETESTPNEATPPIAVAKMAPAPLPEAPPRRAVPSTRPPVPDRSLADEKYIELGFPSSDGTWNESEMTRAVACITKLAAKHPEQLPRFRSRASGRVFACIIDRECLKPLHSRTQVIGRRLYLAQQYVRSLVTIARLYAQAEAAQKVGREDLVEVAGAELEGLRAVFDLIGEARAPIAEQDARGRALPKRLLDQTREQARIWTAEAVGWSLIALGDDRSPLEVRERLVALLQKNLPALAPKLPRATRVELVLRLHRLAADPRLAELNEQMTALRYAVHTVVPEKVPSYVAKVPAEPPPTRDDLPDSRPSGTYSERYRSILAEMYQPTPERIRRLVLFSVLPVFLAPLICLLNAWLLKVAARRVQDLAISYGAAYVTSLIECAVSFGLGLPLNVGYALSDGVARWGVAPVMVVAYAWPFLVWPPILRLRHDTSLGQGVLIRLVMTLITMGIAAVLAIAAIVIVILVALVSAAPK